ncbi:ABC-three component system protein [Pseudomonas fluorescens]|uniref:ABC-three component system protein n=1 Tax=Pseudomonas fluorescens TaxID=294 RepID=UPI002023A2E7|nr:ABC-three component system protein [Pseudomonas fluorescens]
MDKTAAPGAGAGFDYQYYYFLYQILNLKKGQSAGLESKDDVHSDLENDIQLLFQLKHTLQRQASDLPIALTELDSDLWKTLYNWTMVITDPNDNRKLEKDQLAFVKRTEFHLVSNKSQSNRNKLGKLLTTYSDDQDPETLDRINARISEIEVSTSDTTIKNYITTVKSISSEVKKEFFKRIHFKLSETELIQKIKDSLACKLVPPHRIDETYERLNSNIRDDNYLIIIQGNAFTVHFDDFFTKYWKIFQDSRNKRLSNLRFEPALPDNLLDQPFIKQLLAIDDICADEEELITEYSTFKVRWENSLEQWQQDGEVVLDEVTKLHKEVHLRWRDHHRSIFKDCIEDDIKKNGRGILSSLRKDNYKLGDDELSTEYSNGELYNLSDKSRIGWHRDWKSI